MRGKGEVVVERWWSWLGGGGGGEWKDGEVGRGAVCVGRWVGGWVL